MITQDQVDKLNAHQQNPNYHPYTCGGNRTDSSRIRALIKESEAENG